MLTIITMIATAVLSEVIYGERTLVHIAFAVGRIRITWMIVSKFGKDLIDTKAAPQTIQNITFWRGHRRKVDPK